MLRTREERLRGGEGPIARCRRRAGLSQAEAARRMGWSPQTWADYERGRNNPTLRTLRRIARALGCEVRDVVG